MQPASWSSNTPWPSHYLRIRRMHWQRRIVYKHTITEHDTFFSTKFASKRLSFGVLLSGIWYPQLLSVVLSRLCVLSWYLWYGVIFQQNLSFDDQVDAVLRTCSQRVYLLKLLRDQGIPPAQHGHSVPCYGAFKNTLRAVCLGWSHHSRSEKPPKCLASKNV